MPTQKYPLGKGDSGALDRKINPDAGHYGQDGGRWHHDIQRRPRKAGAPKAKDSGRKMGMEKID